MLLHVEMDATKNARPSDKSPLQANVEFVNRQARASQKFRSKWTKHSHKWQVPSTALHKHLSGSLHIMHAGAQAITTLHKRMAQKEKEERNDRACVLERAESQMHAVGAQLCP